MTDTDLTTRLTEQLRPDGAPNEATAENAEPWSITGLETAAWASRKAAAARRQAATIAAWAASEKARIDTVASAETVRCERDAEFFEEHLALYLKREIDAGRRTKSLALPGGTIKMTARQPRIDVNEAEFLAWAKAADRADLVRVKESVDKTALRKAAQLAEDGIVAVDGEIVPGVAWEPQDDSITFVVADGEDGGDA